MKTKPKLNREWHEQHRMPENANTDQRIKWHLEHAKNCGCRPIPVKLKQEMINRGYRLDN